MTLLRQVSERLDKNGKPFVDYYLCWRDKDKVVHYVRVRPCFAREIGYLRLASVSVPTSEPLEKYVD